MRSLKLNIALVVALFALSFTAVTKAGILGKRSVTRCFWNIDLVSADCTARGNINGFMTPRLTCSWAKTQATITPYVTGASVASSLANPGDCPPAQQYFCCAMLTEIQPNDPGYPCATFLDLGDGVKKYKISNPNNSIFCKPN